MQRKVPRQRPISSWQPSLITRSWTKRGVFGGAAPLKPACTATTVRGKREHLFVTDGPFADTKEQLAGYYILECADLDDAIAWAKKIPRTSDSDDECVEIRPIQEMRSRE
jgi:hypothetical protein